MEDEESARDIINNVVEYDNSRYYYKDKALHVKYRTLIWNKILSL